MHDKDPGESRRGFFRQVSVGATLLTLSACQNKGEASSDSPKSQKAEAEKAQSGAQNSELAAAVGKPKADAADGGSERSDNDGLPEGISAEHFVVHGTSPLNLETRRDAFGTAWITPIDRAYLRANLPLPPASILDNPEAWELEVLGVQKPGKITLAKLRELPLVTVAAVLQCSGNGRAYFPHQPSGSPWTVGAAANLVWTGIRVADLVKAMGGLADKKAKFCTATGGEAIPAGLDAKQMMVQRSVPAKKALKDAILAWDANSEPLSLAHGGPLRFVVPGYYGVNFVKYVKALDFGRSESDAKIQQSSYRIRPIGEKGGPQHPTMGAMNVKSFLTLPAGPRAKAGTQQIVGVAFAGENAIKKVEVSLDNGKQWIPATLVGPDLGPFAWRQFSVVANLRPGKHRLVSRAVDVRGNRQPKDRMNNHRGYGNNSWQDMALEIEVVA